MSLLKEPRALSSLRGEKRPPLGLATDECGEQEPLGVGSAADTRPRVCCARSCSAAGVRSLESERHLELRQRQTRPKCALEYTRISTLRQMGRSARTPERDQQSGSPTLTAQLARYVQNSKPSFTGGGGLEEGARAVELTSRQTRREIEQ